MLTACILVTALWNLLTFGTMFLDKRSARLNYGRVPEKTLFLMALLFGGVGILAGMYVFRHKTRHMSFVIGIPAAIIADIVLINVILTG